MQIHFTLKDMKLLTGEMEFESNQLIASHKHGCERGLIPEGVDSKGQVGGKWEERGK